MADHRPDDELDPILKRAFAEAAPPSPDAAFEAAFLARVREAMAKVERRRRVLRWAALAAYALLVLSIAPAVAELTLVMVQAALSPGGALTAIGVSILAASWALKRGLA